MSFIIKQNSTLPELKYYLTQRILEKYGISEEMLFNCAVTFSMIDISTGKYIISNVPASFQINEDRYLTMHESKYVLLYRFKLNQTRKIGRYKGEFKLDLFDNGKYTFSGYDDLDVNISKSITKTTLV